MRNDNQAISDFANALLLSMFCALVSVVFILAFFGDIING